MLTFKDILTVFNITDNKCLNKRYWLFIGTQCNVSCSFCYYRKHHKYFKTLEELEFLMQHVLNIYHFEEVDISGGEPSIYPDLEQLVLMLRNKFQLKVGVVTNGFSHKHLDLFDDRLLTFHGFEDDYYLSVGSKKLFSVFINTLEFCEKHDIFIRINFVLFNENQYNKLDNYLEFLQQFKVVKQVNLLPINAWSDQKNTTFNRYRPLNIHNIYNFEINIRYFPYCLTNRPEFVVSMLGHIWDKRDWSVLSYKLPDKILRNDDLYRYECIHYVQTRLSSTHKMLDICSKCKYFKICDGIQLKQYDKIDKSLFKPLEGEYVYDPRNIRKSCPGDL